MINSKLETKVRHLVLEDLDVILAIDHTIRSREKAITYAFISTESILNINRKANRLNQPSSYIDLIDSDVKDLLELGFVAEVAGHVRGFILGNIIPGKAGGRQEGEILILGVHPDYRHMHIGAQLVEKLCKEYRSRGVRTLHIYIDQQDKQMLGFCENTGFFAAKPINYIKNLVD
jgi:ribosomal protein S18 acetylase RimI-like enzyme